jgi:mannosyltransferase
MTMAPDMPHSILSIRKPTTDHPNKPTISLLLLLLFAFALRVIGLDRLSLAYDEAATALMARATPAEIIAFHWDALFEHLPVWVLLMHLWSNLAGQSEFALRFLPALAGTLIVAFVWRLAQTIWPDRPRLPFLGAILVALAPVLVYYSQEARMYTLVALLMLLSLLLMLRLCNESSWKMVIAFWVVNWCMLGLHYVAALGLAIQVLVIALQALFIGPVRRIPSLKLLIAYVGAFIPLLLWMNYSPGFRATLQVVLDAAKETSTTWQTFLGDLWRELSFGAIRWQPPTAKWGYILAPLLLVGALIVIARPSRTRTAQIGAWTVVSLALLPILSGAIALRNLTPRYILWVIPVCYLLIAYLAATLWHRHWLAGLGVMLLVLGVDLIALQHYFGSYRKSEYQEMTAYLEANGDPNTESLLLEAPRQHLLARYYISPEWVFYPMPTLPLSPYWPITAPLIVPEEEDQRILTWFSAFDGLWVSYSSENEVDQGEFLSKYLAAVAYRQQCTQWLDVRLCHYLSPQHLTHIALNSAPTLFGKELALTNIHTSVYPSTSLATDLMVQLDWSAQQKPTLDYKVSLRLLNEDGTIVAQADEYPIGPLLVPTTWNIEDKKPGYFSVPLPPNLPGGLYQLQVNLYDGSTLAPTPHTKITNAPGENLPTTAPITVAELHVGDTMQLVPVR